MSDPSYLLQAAIVPRLKQAPALAALVGGGVYDEVPAGAPFPYVTVGGGQVIGDDIDCADISEVFFQIHAWARPPSARAIVKKIAGAVCDAMKAPITLTGFDVQIQDYQQTQWLDDPDGLTQHAMVVFRFIIVNA
jgi:hypothetical protein